MNGGYLGREGRRSPGDGRERENCVKAQQQRISHAWPGPYKGALSRFVSEGARTWRAVGHGSPSARLSFFAIDTCSPTTSRPPLHFLQRCCPPAHSSRRHSRPYAGCHCRSRLRVLELNRGASILISTPTALDSALPTTSERGSIIFQITPPLAPMPARGPATAIFPFSPVCLTGGT